MFWLVAKENVPMTVGRRGHANEACIWEISDKIAVGLFGTGWSLGEIALLTAPASVR